MAWDYVQSGDPGAVGPGKTWVVDNIFGMLKVRNTSNTAWVEVGYLGIADLNNITPAGSGTPTNIIGATGWADDDAHDFKTSVTKAGKNLVDEREFDEVEETLTAIVDATIASQITSGIASSSVASDIAVASGSLDCYNPNGSGAYGLVQPWGPPFFKTIPLPLRGDGSEAEEANCIWMAQPQDVTFDASLHSGTRVSEFRFEKQGPSILDRVIIDPTDQRVMAAVYEAALYPMPQGKKFTYLIIGVK